MCVIVLGIIILTIVYANIHGVFLLIQSKFAYDYHAVLNSQIHLVLYAVCGHN